MEGEFKAYITTAGAAMISSCLDTGTVIFSRAEVGQGRAANEAAARAATALFNKHENANVSISRVTKTEGAAQVTVQLSSSNMEAGTEMTISEIGIYMASTASQTPVLACYAYYTDSRDDDHISGGALFNRLYDILIAISTSTDFTVSAVQLSGFQTTIDATGILIGDGQGGVTAATGVSVYSSDASTYSKGNHTHGLANDASLTGTLPISKGGTGASTKDGAKTALEIPVIKYSATEPPYAEGAIWLQPVS